MPSHQALADKRQRLATPGIELLERGIWSSSKRSVALAVGRGSTFSETSQITPSTPIEPASRRDTS
jgi:hypothetical protein